MAVGLPNLRVAFLVASALVVVAGRLAAQAITGTISGSNQAILFPSPGIGLPSPTQIPITGIPPGALPNAVAFFGSDGALVSDAHFHKVYVVSVSQHAVTATIDTYPPFTGSSPTYDGSGTLVVSPDSRFALAQSGSPLTLAVIAAPFGAASAITTVPLPGAISGSEVRGIAFDPAGRAFVFLSAGAFSGISVLDPPYSAIAFTIVTGSEGANAISVTPDGRQLLVTSFGSNTIKIFSAPFSAASAPASLMLPPMVALDGIAVTPDGDRALVVSPNVSRLFVVAAPFSAVSTVEEIPMPAGLDGFEDVGISADGSLAILTGGGLLGAPPEEIPFILGPFSAGSAKVFTCRIVGGRGTGSVRIRQAGGAQAQAAVPVLAPFATALLVVALAGTAIWALWARTSG